MGLGQRLVRGAGGIAPNPVIPANAGAQILWLGEWWEARFRTAEIAEVRGGSVRHVSVSSAISAVALAT